MSLLEPIHMDLSQMNYFINRARINMCLYENKRMSALPAE